jgi:hypothetical protein
MKIKKGITIASVVHLILWVIFLPVSVVEKFKFINSTPPPEWNSLDFAIAKGISNMFIITAVAGIITATILFLSLRAVFRCMDVKLKRKRISALCFSTIATISFYLFVMGVLNILNSDVLLLLPIVWLLCELCCGALLIISKLLQTSK